MNPYASCDALPIDVLTEYPIFYYSPEESDYICNGSASTLPLSNNAITTKRISSIEQMQLLVATDTAIAHYPGGLTAVPLADKINFKFLKNQTSNYRIQAIFQKDGPKIGLIHQYLASFKWKTRLSKTISSLTKSCFYVLGFNHFSLVSIVLRAGAYQRNRPSQASPS